MAAPASMVDEDGPHRTGGHGKEVDAILPFRFLQFGQLQVRLVEEIGCLQRVTRSLPRHVAFRKPMQLLVKAASQLGESRVAASDLAELAFQASA
jgi:hypothetical protein